MTVMTRLHRIGVGVALATVSVVGVRVAAAQDDHLREQSQLKATKACDSCNLSGVNFSKADLKGVSLSSATLEGTIFYRANLTGANLGGANLSKANLTMADLTNTNFGNANLAGANLSGSIGASLSGAVTTDTTTCPDGQAGPCR
jgi:uncharacterized protein YjbI with pentapeptide repeats